MKRARFSEEQIIGVLKEAEAFACPATYRPSLSRKLLSRCRMATWVAIQKVRRSRALPYFESLVRPRNVPD